MKWNQFAFGGRASWSACCIIGRIIRSTSSTCVWTACAKLAGRMCAGTPSPKTLKVMYASGRFVKQEQPERRQAKHKLVLRMYMQSPVISPNFWLEIGSQFRQYCVLKQFNNGYNCVLKQFNNGYTVPTHSSSKWPPDVCGFYRKWIACHVHSVRLGLPIVCRRSTYDSDGHIFFDEGRKILGVYGRGPPNVSCKIETNLQININM